MEYRTIKEGINDVIRNASKDDKFIHALSESLPQCDLKRGVDKVEDIVEGDACNVYCAQASCDAAKKYMKEHASHFARCSSVNYLKEGSIRMDADLLVDGFVCHDAIHKWNSQNST